MEVQADRIRTGSGDHASIRNRRNAANLHEHGNTVTTLQKTRKTRKEKCRPESAGSSSWVSNCCRMAAPELDTPRSPLMQLFEKPQAVSRAELLLVLVITVLGGIL